MRSRNLLVGAAATIGVGAAVTLMTLRAPAEARAPRPVFDGADTTRSRIPIRLVPVADGIERPTDIQPVPGRPGTLVVLSKTGAAHWIAGAERGEWFSIRVPTRSEQGLLGLTFHPGFAVNGRFFVHYTARGERSNLTRVEEWSASAVAPFSVGPKPARVVLEVPQPYPNHNGGQIAFGPDGMLYIGLGDGGAANDPHGHGQDRGSLLGAILRLDVDGGAPYAVPKDNPFAGPRAEDGVRPEIWAWGLRNPWRFAFAPDARMVVADVGQNRLEEVTLVAAGENHGWALREAARCFPPGARCSSAGLVDPVWQYPRGEGVSITGGYVYTGPAKALAGRYLFGDFGSGRIWALTLPPPGANKSVQPDSAVAALGRWPIQISTFGAGHDGSIYVADFGGGVIYRVMVEE